MDFVNFLFPSGLLQPEKGFKFAIDSLFLSCFVEPKNRDKIIDIGCGCGVVSFGILLNNKDKDLSIVGVDSDIEMVNCAQKNASALKLDGSFKPILLDICEIKNTKKFEAEEFSIAVTNPPYRDPLSGRTSPFSAKNHAKFEQVTTLEDFIHAAKYLVKNKGKLYIVYLSERLNYLFGLLKKYNFGPKRIKFIHGHIEKPSKVVLLECVKNSNPQLIVEPPLIQYEKNTIQNLYTQMALDFCPFIKNRA